MFKLYREKNKKTIISRWNINYKSVPLQPAPPVPLLLHLFSSGTLWQFFLMSITLKLRIPICLHYYILKVIIDMYKLIQKNWRNGLNKVDFTGVGKSVPNLLHPLYWLRVLVFRYILWYWLRVLVFRYILWYWLRVLVFRYCDIDYVFLYLGIVILITCSCI